MRDHKARKQRRERVSEALRRARELGPAELGVVHDELCGWLAFAVRKRLVRAALPLDWTEEIVQDCWVRSLPALGATLQSREGSLTRAALAYLATVARRRVQELLSERCREPGRLETGTSEAEAEAAGVAASSTGVVSKLMRQEEVAAVLARIEAFVAVGPPEDAELLRLRGIEDVAPGVVADLLGLSRGAVNVRYSRLLSRIRAALGTELTQHLAENGTETRIDR